MSKSILHGSKIENFPGGARPGPIYIQHSLHNLASMNRVHSMPWQFTHPGYATASQGGSQEACKHSNRAFHVYNHPGIFRHWVFIGHLDITTVTTETGSLFRSYAYLGPVYCGTVTVTRRVPGRNAEGRLFEFRYYKCRQVVYVGNLDIKTVNSQETRHTLKIVNSTDLACKHIP